jgi:uncharacterized membrane protein YccF (DUF307 family)
MNSTNTVLVDTRRNPGCLLQILWFAFIGIWLGQLWIAVAWILMVTIIGIPIGITMLNNIPKVIALREPARPVLVRGFGSGRMEQRPFEPEQLPFLLRAVYFLLIGWWFSALWMELAYALCLSIIGLPLGFWMFDRTPAILTLRQ